MLPLLATDAGMRLQLGTGVASHSARFGAWAGGLWLPECAYEPGLERELAEHGVRAFCVDQTRVPGFDHLTPVATEAGPVALPVDWQTVELVWHGERGYPADGTYRDYHRRTLHDLKPWNNAGDPYDHAAAGELARAHARDFVERAAARVADGGILCCALDTELLGHWWYEGPAWLAAVLEEAPRSGLGLVTASEALERAEPVERPLAASTWGSGKDLSTWDSARVAEFAFAARAAELRIVAAAGGAGAAPALARAARELLAHAGERLVVHGHPRARRRLPARAPRRAPRELRRRAGRSARLRAAPDARLRDLAPHLDLASLTTP